VSPEISYIRKICRATPMRSPETETDLAWGGGYVGQGVAARTAPLRCRQGCQRHDAAGRQKQEWRTDQTSLVGRTAHLISGR
jgi:hypothetical protein